jgi:ABC-type phosphate/phosphonate transport system substrate-binding protein
LEDSNSGFNMLRHYLLAYRTPQRRLLYSRSVGNLINPLGALRAVAEGRVDVVPVDSFCHDLFLASDHPLTALTRTLHTTPPSPMPALVASPDLPEDLAAALRAALLRAHRAPLLGDALQAALVGRFVNVEATTYDYTEALAQAAIAAGYPLPA